MSYFYLCRSLHVDAVQIRFKANPPSSLDVARRIGRWLTESKTRAMVKVRQAQHEEDDDFFK